MTYIVNSMLLMYRHEFYQKPEEVVVTIFAKGVPASSVDIEFGEQIVQFCCVNFFFFKYNNFKF